MLVVVYNTLGTCRRFRGGSCLEWLGDLTEGVSCKSGWGLYIPAKKPDHIHYC